MTKKFKTASLILSLILFFTALITPSFASEEKKVAILDFVNEGPYERLNYLKYLLPQILISGLVGEDGIAVLKRHQLEALIDESGLAQKELLEEKPFTPEEADIIVEGSWAEQSKSGLSFEETPLLIKATVREGSSKKILGKIEVIGKKDEFARIQKEPIAGALSVISGEKASIKKAKEVVSSWEAGEYMGRGLSIMKSLGVIPVPSNNLSKLRHAIELFKRAIYLDPESSSLPYEKIAFCYTKLLSLAGKESETATKSFRESIKWHGYLIDKFWDDPIICPSAMKSLINVYYIGINTGSGGKEIELLEAEKEEFFKRLEQLMGPLMKRHGPSFIIQRSLKYAADITDYSLQEYKYSIRLKRKILNKCSDSKWWNDNIRMEENLEFRLPLSIARTIRLSGHIEEAIKELEMASKRNQDSKYVCYIHARIAGLAFAPNLSGYMTNNYELAKKHFALAISSAERANQDDLCLGLALHYVGEKIIDDSSCSDSLRQAAFELNIRRFCGKKNQLLPSNLSHFARFLHRHADLYPPAKDMLAKLVEKHKANYEAPLSDILNQIIWRKPLWHWQQSLGRLGGLSTSAVFKEEDVIWIAFTTPLSCISLWQLNLNTCVIDCVAAYTNNVSRNIKITSIAKSGSRFFIGTTEGLLVLNKKKEWEMFTTKDGLPFSKIRCLAVDKDSCWIGCGSIYEGTKFWYHSTTGALCRYTWNKSSWKTYPVKNVPTALASSGDELWIGMWNKPMKKPIKHGNKQIYRMNKNTGELSLVHQSFRNSYSYKHGQCDIPLAFYDENNSIWCATTQECLKIDKSTNKVIFKIDKYINDIAKDEEGCWFASHNTSPLKQFRRENSIIFFNSNETYSIIVSDDKYNRRHFSKIKAVYPHKQFIWVIFDDMNMEICGLERAVLRMSDNFLKQIAVAYRMKNIDLHLAIELLEKLKRDLPKSAGLRLEIADCYKSLTTEAMYEKNAYAAKLRKNIELYHQKWKEALQEAYELDPKSAFVLDEIRQVEKYLNVKILDKK